MSTHRSSILPAIDQLTIESAIWYQSSRPSRNIDSLDDFLGLGENFGHPLKAPSFLSYTAKEVMPGKETGKRSRKYRYY